MAHTLGMTGRHGVFFGRKSAAALVGVFLFFVLLSMSACATGETMIRHSFQFDARNDSPEIEVLDYQYGSSKQFATYANKERIAMGQTFPYGGLSGYMPRGEFLYVKWRDKSTGQVFEDKVDLTSRLPDDLEGLELRFVVCGPQLYIFLTWPWDGKPYEQEPMKNRYVPVPGGVRRHYGQKVVQIYPDPA